jgi:hypothetical protein
MEPVYYGVMVSVQRRLLSSKISSYGGSESELLFFRPPHIFSREHCFRPEAVDTKVKSAGYSG